MHADRFEIAGPRGAAPKVVQDTKALAAALSEVRTTASLDVRVPVDVLVADSIDLGHAK